MKLYCHPAMQVMYKVVLVEDGLGLGDFVWVIFTDNLLTWTQSAHSKENRFFKLGIAIGVEHK
jgi:hypothetical protein